MRTIDRDTPVTILLILFVQFLECDIRDVVASIPSRLVDGFNEGIKDRKGLCQVLVTGNDYDLCLAER